jgi:hypothetical protein
LRLIAAAISITAGSRRWRMQRVKPVSNSNGTDETHGT